MTKEKNNRVKWLHVRLTEDEFNKLNKAFKNTTQTKLSDYVRALLLGKPMIAAVRNQSLQEIVNQLFKLRKDLNGIANNFNQVVHKLHTLDHAAQFQNWILNYEMDKRSLLKNVEAMRVYIDQTAEKWLRS